ncbi:MAG: MATE family efflux transporter [Eubacteriales bacterium]|nr:MATE family efflux transporter [Eubacteriales bacterium]
MRNRKLLYNTALLTVSSLTMNAIAMAFRAWLVGRIGTAGIGLYQLVVSVMNLTATFAISGVRFAATRLVAEELGAAHAPGVRAAVGRCLGYAGLFGFAAALILRALAEPIGFLWIGDARTVLSLRLAAFSMPCISLCAALSGYFTANGRVWKPTLIHLTEQLAGILLVICFLRRTPAGDLEKSCAAVTLGSTAADLLGLGLMALAYVLDRRRYDSGEEAAGLTGRMLRIAVPLALSAYARSALTTLRHLLVPRGLRAAGWSADGALSGYGVIQGMVLPVLFFPACIMGALAELIVPELTASQVRGDGRAITATTGELLRASVWFSGAVGLFLFVFADRLGLAVYRSFEAGRYIRVLAPLVPVMYTDMAVDGCLKGLGQQVWSMGINITESLLGLLLVWQLLPRWGLAAYIGVFYFTELFNFSLSLLRLRRVTRPFARAA